MERLNPDSAAQASPLTGEQAFFEALADPIRRRILVLLLEADERCVCDLHLTLDASQPKVSGVWMRYRIHPQLPAWALRVLIHMKDGMACAPAATAPSACAPRAA